MIIPPNSINNQFIPNDEATNIMNHHQATRSIGESNLYSRSTKRVNSSHNRPLANNCKTDGQDANFRSNRRDDDEDQSGGSDRNGRMFNGSNKFNFNQNTNGMRSWNNENQNNSNYNGGSFKKNADFLIESEDENDVNQNNLKSSYIVEVADEFVDADLSLYNEVFVEDDYDKKLNEEDNQGHFLNEKDESDGEIDYGPSKNEANTTTGNCLKRTTNFTNYKANLITIQESREHVQKSSSESDLNDSRDEIDFCVESDDEKKEDNQENRVIFDLDSAKRSGLGSDQMKNVSLVDEKKNLENVERQRGKPIINRIKVKILIWRQN